MKHRVLLFLLVICCCSKVQAVTFDVDGMRYEILSQTNKEVSVAIIPKSLSYPTYSTYTGDINIPEKVSFNGVEYTVVGIGEDAFANCQKLGNFSMPSSVRFIGFGAFAYSNISTVELHEGIDSIGAAAFRDCDNLKEIVLPKSLKHLDTTVFSTCRNLKKITILSCLTSIPDDSFTACI